MKGASVDTIKKRARHAGLLYFVMSLIAVIGLEYAPGKLIVHDDAAATAANLRAHETLLRISMASELAHQAICIWLAMALYDLFRGVDRHQAQLLVILGALVSVPIMFANVVNDVAALTLAKGGGFLTVFDPKQLDALSYLFVRLHSAGVMVTSIFWGLWLFPFGILVIRSGFIPRAFGWMLFAAGASYLVDATQWVLAPGAWPVVGQVTDILRIAEVPIIFWLLIWGARGPGVNDAIAPEPLRAA
jgi:hypothetical protein